MAEFRRDDYLISTDKTKLDIPFIHETLSLSCYWALGRSWETVQASIEHSLCFGLYAGAQQLGFARVVTDSATFAWLCDVFVLEPHRGQGLGRWLIQSVVAHPLLHEMPTFVLATRDAHELYRKYGGFGALEIPGKWMIRHPA